MQSNQKATAKSDIELIKQLKSDDYDVQLRKISVQSVNNKQKCGSVIMDSVLKLKRHNEIIIINVTVVESETERKKGGGCTSKVASLHHLTILHFNSIIYFKFIWLR